MTKPRILIWGASGHALVVADIITRNADYEICGFIDNTPNPPKKFLGLPVVQSPGEIAASHIIIGFGNCAERMKLAQQVVQDGYELATAIHPSAIIAPGVEVGKGTVIAAGVIVNPAARIGDNCIINTAALVEHECVVEDGVHICPGVRLAGAVHVKRGAWVGIGSTVKDKILIGEHSMIGAGSVVVRDIPANVIAYGNPARVQRSLSRVQRSL
jgi:acetyltransferase EpsM